MNGANTRDRGRHGGYKDRGDRPCMYDLADSSIHDLAYRVFASAATAVWSGLRTTYPPLKGLRIQRVCLLTEKLRAFCLYN